VLSLLLALVAVSHAAGTAFFLEKFQAGVIAGEFAVEVLNGET